MPEARILLVMQATALALRGFLGGVPQGGADKALIVLGALSPEAIFQGLGVSSGGINFLT